LHRIGERSRGLPRETQPQEREERKEMKCRKNSGFHEKEIETGEGTSQGGKCFLALGHTDPMGHQSGNL